METSATKDIALARLTATQTAGGLPEHSQETRFGTAQLDPLCPPYRNGLVGCRCATGEVEALLAEVGAVYAGASRPFCKISGCDEATYAALKPELECRDWREASHVVMVWSAPPERAAEPAVEIEVIAAADLAESESYLTFFEEKDMPMWRHLCRYEPRLGGEQLVGWLDGEPAGIAGWFVVDCVARFRTIVTKEKFRNRGVATALIRYVQEHPTVRAQEALVAMPYADRPFPRVFYERMGFRVVGRHWVFKRDIADGGQAR
jgi:GNAT superfamily N-acetyltransferase